MDKIKLRIIEIINSLLILGYLFGIVYLLDSKIESDFKLLLLILIINGFYWYYKGYISKASDDTNHFLLLGDRKK